MGAPDGAVSATDVVVAVGFKVTDVSCRVGEPLRIGGTTGDRAKDVQLRADDVWLRRVKDFSFGIDKATVLFRPAEAATQLTEVDEVDLSLWLLGDDRDGRLPLGRWRPAGCDRRPDGGEALVRLEVARPPLPPATG